MKLVWFKRDLRISDHLPLFKASKDPQFLALYIFEPELWKQDDLSKRQYLFLKNALSDLEYNIQKLGGKLVIKAGEPIEIFKEITNQINIKEILSHQETWNDYTYKRDIEVRKFFDSKNISWEEIKQNGVIRRLKDRNGWGKSWNIFMNEVIIPIPNKINTIDLASDEITFDDFSHKDNIKKVPVASRSEAEKLLSSFLLKRSQNYSKEISSPISAENSCSRLSYYISFGIISIREIYQAASKRSKELDNSERKWKFSLKSFMSRLRWHCHFIQKLESEPKMEFENLNPLFDDLRKDEFNEDYFEAWMEGKTGFPMIDACMRSLIETGWLNFRMRAMLVSFASYHLWLDWEKTSKYLARLFIDYEPGIHYSQFQMQSGTTGINAIRIYNPIKQSIDHDKNGEFIKKWIPELVNLDKKYIHTPWEVPEKLGSYPMPIIEEKDARKKASDKIYSIRKLANYREVSNKILNKHGSRKSGLKQIKEKNKNQLEFAIE